MSLSPVQNLTVRECTEKVQLMLRTVTILEMLTAVSLHDSIKKQNELLRSLSGQINMVGSESSHLNAQFIKAPLPTIHGL